MCDDVAEVALERAGLGLDYTHGCGAVVGDEVPHVEAALRAAVVGILERFKAVTVAIVCPVDEQAVIGGVLLVE